MAKTVKTHCRITDYIDANYPDVGQIIRATCADMTLNSLKGKAGITFVIPSDKTLKDIEKLIYSDKVDDMHTAQDMMNAHIMKDVFKTPSAWIAKKEDIPNSLLPPQHVEVKEATSSEIKFANGAVAKIDPNFKDASKRENLAVWKMVSGELPHTGGKPASLKFSRMKPAGKTGSYQPKIEHATSTRFKIALAVENAYAIRQSEGRLLTGRNKDVFIETSLSLIEHIMIRHENLFFSSVLPVISLDKMDFYYLVEPHRVSGTYLIDEIIIGEWWSQCDIHKVNAKSIVKKISEKLKNNKSSSQLYTDRDVILDAIQNVRSVITNVCDARGRNAPEKIKEYYDNLILTNSIGNVSNVYPSEILEYYKQNPGLKLIHDELRFITFSEFTKLENARFDFGQFYELTNMIGEYLYSPEVGVDQSGHARLLNTTTIKSAILPNEKISEIKIFANSTFFMYIPLTENEATKLKYKHSLTRPDPDNITLYNISGAIYTRHGRLLQDSALPGQSNESLVKSVLDLNVADLGPDVRDALKKKFS